MKRAFGRVAILGALGAAVLTGYHFTAGAAPRLASATRGHDDEGRVGGVAEMIRQMAALGGGYRLSSLKNLAFGDDYIVQNYVDPQRIDYAGMYRSALDAVERRVPQVLLRLENGDRRLHVAVGNYTTVLTVQPLESVSAMEEELKRVALILEENLDKKDIPHEDVEAAMINGVLQTLDPHSIFLAPDNSKKMEEDNEGEFGGLGITIVLVEGQLTIEYPLEETPADRAGLRAQDRITRIEGESTINIDLEEAVSKMRGPPGSPVTITVERDSWDAPRDFTIVRDKIKASRVKGELLEGGIGWVYINQFHIQVETQLEEVLTRLSREAGPDGLKGVVLDMRDNPGGFLHQAIAVADKFLVKGTIVSTVERNGKNRDQRNANASGTEPDYPMAVLMSGNSASAAEIVAGALKNEERAIIIGERSFGKGSVQNLYSFADGSKLKLTVARYLTPGDHSIQSVGIPPDIMVEGAVLMPPREIEIEEGGVKRKEMSGPRVSLFSRDRLQREADLEGHLVNDENLETPPVYGLRYLAPLPVEGEERSDRRDPRKDFQVMFARDVLLAAHGSRRADVIRDAATVVASRSKAEGIRIEKAFDERVGINWGACANPDDANTKLELSLGADGVLDAGQLEIVKLTVTNLDTRPLCQVAAVSKSGNDALDGVEFYFGKIPAGESRSYETKVRLTDGYPTEVSVMDVSVMDASRKQLAAASLPVKTLGIDLPRYAWSWTFSDVAGGDGDGTVEVGETIDMNVDVLNVGTGIGGVAHFELKKDASMGKAVELRGGSFKLPRLAPGARASGKLSFLVTRAPSEDAPVGLELRVRDAERYDYASIIKGEFYNYYTQTEELTIPLGSVPAAGRREPPSITVSRAPGLTIEQGEVTISGVATDDVGVHDVIVYHGAQKIAYAGGGEGTGLASVPFTATATLEPGNNLIVVLVRDSNGLTSTRAIDVYRPPTATAAAPVPPEKKVTP
ncbi:MAG: S41 family peptidase [Pseudomonadota bacterium]|nr:S41 family peptidase [Pseudomonadota bacterium]